MNSTTHYSKFFIIQLFFLLVSVSNHAEMPFTHLKNSNAIVTKPHLSLINGFIWWKNHMIKNLYTYGNKEDATIQLLHDLFYLQRDQITFDITTLNRNPARYFSTSTIGIIISILELFTEKNSLDTQDKEELYKALYQALKKNLKFKKLITQAQNKKSAILLETSISSAPVKNYLALQQLNKEIVDQKKLLNENKKNKQKYAEINAGLAKLIEQQIKLTKEVGSFNQLKKNPEIRKFQEKLYQEDLTKENLKKFVHHLIDAFDETLPENHIYLPFTVQQILLAFLWKKSESKEDINEFAQDALLLNPSLINEDALKEYMAMQPYSEEDFIEFQKKLPTLEAISLLEEYEQLVLYLYANKVWQSILPPMIMSIGNTEYLKYTFSDCVETALRNFLNCIFYNNKTKHFNITSLVSQATIHDENFVMKDSIPLIPNPDVIEFYTKNTDPNEAQLITTHNAWASIVSAIFGIVYRTPQEKPICEIDPSIRNVFRIINHLLFGNNPNFDELTIPERLTFLCKVLSNKTLELSWSSEQDLNDLSIDNNATIIFSINAIKLNWIFQPDHSFIKSLEETTNTISLNSILPLLKKNNDYLDSEINTTILNLLSFIINNIKIKKQLNSYILYPAYILQFYLFNNSQNKDEWLITIYNAIQNTYEPKTLPIIKNMLSAITPEDNSNTIPKILNTIITKRLTPLNYFVDENIKKVSLIGKRSLLENIILYENKDFYSLVLKEINNLPALDQYKFLNTIIKDTTPESIALLQKSFNTLSDQNKKYLLSKIINEEIKEFASLTFQEFPNLAEKQKENIMLKIIKNKVTTLYPMIEKQFNLLTQQSKKTIMNAIIKKEVISLYPLIEKEFVLLPQKDQKQISTIIKKLSIEALLPLINE